MIRFMLTNIIIAFIGSGPSGLQNPVYMTLMLYGAAHMIRFMEACRDILGFVTNPIQNTTLFARRQLAGGLERGNSVAGPPQHHP